MEAGLHVLCEKPPALDAAEAERMRQVAQRSGRVLRFAFNNRCRSEVLALAAAVHSGEVGRINGIQAVWERRCGIPGFGGWFTTRAQSGGGALIDLVHMLDLGLWLTGYPAVEQVLARAWDDFRDDRSRKGPWGIRDGTAPVDVEMACHGAIALVGGSLLTFRASWAEMVEREHILLSVQGSRGGAVLERRWGSGIGESEATDRCLLLGHRDGRPTDRVIPCADDPAMGRVACAASFVLACAGAETPLGTPDEAVALMTIIDAIYASAARR
jgi:predicted dehydrogenase